MRFDFSFSANKENSKKKKLSNRDYQAIIRYNTLITEKVSQFSQLDLARLTKNTQYRIITEKAFNAIVALEHFDNQYQFEEIYIAVYRMNLQSVRKIKKWLTDEAVNCRVVVSSFFRENKRYERWAEELVGTGKGEVAFAWNHAKVFLGKTTCGKYIVFEGSGNLSDNARIEQYLLEDNQQSYEFHQKWIENLFL